MPLRHHILSVLVENTPGALMRGAGTLEEAYAAELLRERAA